MKIKNILTFLAIVLSGLFSYTYGQTPAWTNLGPIPFPEKTVAQVHGIGRCTELKFHATNPNKMYVASASGGLWYSNNKGGSWTNLGTDNITRVQSASIAIDPGNDQIIYWGTGDPNYYYNGQGVYKTTNGGTNWTLSNSGMGNRLVLEILLLPTNSQTIIAATNNGIYKSTNGGSSWTLKSTATPMYDLVFKPGSNGQIVYAVAAKGFYRSTDAGETWTQITSPAFVFGANGCRLAVSPASPNVVYVGNVGAGTLGEIYKSTDGGTTFVNARSELTKCLAGYDAAGGGQGNYNFDIEANPANANELYVCAHVIWRSTDGGATWTQQQTSWAYNLHTDQHHILFDPYVTGQLWNANDGGVWSNTTQGTGAWTPKSDGIAATEIYTASGSNVNKTVNQIGTQDNGEFYSSGGLWYNNRGGDFNTPTVFDYTTNNYTYYAGVSTSGRRRLPGGGQTSLGFPFTPTVAPAFGFTPALTNMGFAGHATALYRSVNLTATTPSWTQVGTLAANILAVGCSPTNSNVIYVFMNNGRIAVSTNAQAATPTFTTYAGPVASATSGRLGVGANPNIAYLSVGQKIYRTKNAGATWTDISTGFPAANVNGLVCDRFNSADGVYASYSLGVYYKDTTKTSWVNYSAGLPIVCNINGLAAYNDGISTGVIRTFFYGRGMWESPMHVPSNNITVALTAPANNATFSAPATINLAATASSTAGAITKVEFYNGTTLLGTDNTSPYTYTWTGVGIGDYLLTAKAYDATGASFGSTVANIKVSLICNSLAGTAFGTSPAYAAGSEYDKAFDGNTNTFFDFNGANGGYTGLDLGVASVINGIRFFPRGGNEGRMNGGKFQGSNVANFASGVVDLYTITSAPASGWNETSVNNATSFRYVRYLSPNNGYCNVAEIQFCGTSNQQPVVSITAPANNALYPATPATVNITATASDPDGTISKVEFYQGTTLLNSDNTSPYSFSWTGVAAGTYSLTAKAYDNTTGVTTSTAVVIIVGNQNPTVSITSPANGASFAQPATITINATAADADGTISKVEFYNGTTLLGSDNSSPYSYIWTGVVSGTYALTARAYDNATGITTSTAVNVTVGNQAPTVAITTPANASTFGTPANITINALASDVDGTISKVEFYNGATLLNSDATSPYAYVWNGVAAGTYTLTAKAYDNSGLVTTSAAVPITVSSGCTGTAWSASTTYVGDASLGAGNGEVVSYNGKQYRAMFWTQNNQPDLNTGVGKPWTDLGACASPNQSPAVTITAPANNAIFTAPATVNITATASDADGTIAKVDFYQGTTKIGTSTASPYTYSWAGVAVGTYQLVAVATDNKGSSGTSSFITITVGNANQNPVVTLTAPLNNAVVNEGSSVSLTATASDPDGTVTKVEFYNGTTLLGTATASPYSVTINNIVAGTYTLTAKATDNNSGATTSSVVTLNVNKLPTIAITAPANNAVVAVGSNVSITTNAADTDGTISKVEFYRGATLLGTVTSAPWNYTITGIAAGTYALTAKVTDNNGGTATSTVVTVIANQNPTITITAPANNAVVAVGSNVTITTNAADADGTISKVEFYNGAALLGTVTTAPWSYTITNIVAGTYTLTAKATDNNGGTATSAVVTVIANQSPVVSITAPANNATFTAGANVTVTATATDADGSVSKVEFYNGATLLGTVTVSPWNYTMTGIAAGTYNLTARATDNRGAVTTSSVVTIVVNTPANQSPTVSITAPANNTTIMQGSAIALVATASDPDGTIAKVEFYNGSTLLGTDNTTPYTFNIANAAPGTYTLTARAYDDKSATANSSVITVVVKTTATIAITGPANNAVTKTGGELTITATASDPDAAIKKVEYLIGTTLLGQSTTQPYTYTGTVPASGTYTVTVKAYDVNGTVIATNTVTVTSNQDPIVSITAPANNAVLTAGTNMTISANASDTDGTVTKVEFFNGATSLGTDNSSPYSVTVNGISAGIYTLTAKATDNNGVVVTSSLVTVTVKSAATIVVTSPSNNEVVTTGSSVNVSVSANDPDNAIKKIEIYDGSTKIGEITRSPYNFNISSLTSGSHIITVRAVDINGVVITSQSVTITGNQAPSVVLTSPLNNTTVAQGSVVVLTANATDIDGTITKVDFYNGVTLVGTLTTAPYTFNWTGLAAGTYNVAAKATDNNGVATTSAYHILVVNQASSIVFTEPGNNTVVEVGTNVVVKVNATDVDGITKVELFDGTIKVGEVTNSPYEFTLTNISVGDHALTVKVTDGKGFVTTSSVLNITGKESDCAKVAWKFGAAYAIGDQASSGGKLYRAHAASINVEPGTDGGTDWTLLGICDLTTVIDNNVVERLVQIFPNPSSGQFYISLANFKDQVLKYRVIDMTGREVAAKTVGKVGGQQMKEEVELPLVDSGNYIVQIMLDNNLFTEKLVIMSKPKAR